MHPFASPKAFADLITSTMFVAPMVGKEAEELLRETLVKPYEYTPSQAQLAARVGATIIKKTTVGNLAELDPLEPAKAIAGTWMSARVGEAARSKFSVQDTFELRDDLTYLYRPKSGARTGGVYVAGFADDGYVAALCSIDGSAEEMRIFPSTSTARVGSTSLSRVAKIPTVYTTLAEAAMKGDLEDMSKHIRSGADVNQLYDMESIETEALGETRQRYISILHLLAYSGPETAVEALLAAGADPNVKSGAGETPLKSAMAAERASVVELLLRYGADANARSIGGDTMLHIALLTGQRQIVPLLLKYGADRNAKNDKGITPLQVARITGMLDLF